MEGETQGGYDYRAYLARRQVFGIFYPNRGQEILPTHQTGFPPLRWAERLRRHVEITIDRLYREQPDHVHILKGMLLGKRGELPASIYDVFRNSGSLHILAVSGLHVGLITALCFLGFFTLPTSPKNSLHFHHCLYHNLRLLGRISPVSVASVIYGNSIPHRADC